ncbi:uncharacterized protein LOC135216586 [Macrobrachium nipponense]|uniref:uncharacterized protein LOC135216586 n=1 Tax=Macrobrachium nipponense TaxID=159736 RepID=UPI0030C86027
MEENFFTRLRKLCRNVDVSIGPLKESLSLPPRCAPQFYDKRNLNQLKKEVQDLKEMNEEMKKTQRSLQNFSNWLQSMQEFVGKQVDDIDKLEKYLVKFGYVPVEKPATSVVSSASLNQEVTVKEQISSSKDFESELAVVIVDYSSRWLDICFDYPNLGIVPVTRSMLCAPQFYDRGLNQLKKEVQDLKEMNEEMKKTQRSLQNFSNWLQSMQELLANNRKLTTSVVSSASLNQEVTVKEQISSSKDFESEAARSEAKSQSTGTSLLDTKDCQSLQEKKTSCEVSCKEGKNKPDLMEYQKTPTLGKMRSALSRKKSVDAGSYGSGLVTVEQWLQGVDNSNLQVTPDVVRMKKLPMKKQEISHDCDKMPNIMISESVPDDTGVTPESLEVSQMPVKNRIPTYKSSSINVCDLPVEPELSEYTTQCEKSVASNISGLPEEPELSEYTTQFLKSVASNIRGNQVPSLRKELYSSNIPGTISNSSEQSDHKEPSYFSCKENISAQNLFAKMDYTSEKPVLSYPGAELASGHGVDQSQKRPPLSDQPSKHGTKIEVECETPKKPVISYASEYAVVKEVETRHPGESVLSAQMINRNTSFHAEITTTKEPLPYQSNESESVNSDSNRTSEKLILSPDALPVLKSSNSSDHLGIQNALPVSPELSDLTMSLLSLQNRMDGQDHPNQYSHENSKLQFSRNGKLISQVRQKENDVKSSNEVGCGVEPSSRKNLWLSSGAAMKFSMDALPPSPQLSETTMKMLSRIK